MIVAMVTDQPGEEAKGTAPMTVIVRATIGTMVMRISALVIEAVVVAAHAVALSVRVFWSRPLAPRRCWAWEIASATNARTWGWSQQ